MPKTDDTLSLYDLLHAVEAMVADAFAASFWVCCEVIAVHARQKGYWVLQVQDPEKGSEAQSQVMVWRSAAARVMGHFQHMTGEPLQAGMQVLLRVKLSISPRWGLSLTADAIDPQYTLGQAHLRLEAIRQKLQQEGVWRKNTALPEPLTFFKVAVVAPDGSAGLGDFMAEAKRLEQNGLCSFSIHHAPFEGTRATRVLTEVLQQLTQPSAYDAVCIVRGGGGTAGIQTLDDEQLIRTACLCPLPLIVGIGHERDHTLLDEVAFLSLGTPSKVIAHVRETIVQQAQQAEHDWNQINTLVERRLQWAEKQCERERQQLQHHVDKTLSRTEESLSRQLQHMRQFSEVLLERSTLSCENLMRESLNLGPQSTLSRGYAWVQGSKGSIQKAEQAQQEETLTLHFSDGPIQVHVEPHDEHP